MFGLAHRRRFGDVKCPRHRRYAPHRMAVVSVPERLEHLRVSRETVQRYVCPRCAASVGQPCKRENGNPRKSNHIDRLRKAQRNVQAGLMRSAGADRG